MTHKQFKFLRSGAVAAMTCLILGAGLAQAQTVMRLNISLPKNSHSGVTIDTFAEEVAKRTDGRYKIETFYAGSLGAERESVEAVQLGTQELTWTSTGPVPNFVPDTRILDIPFLFRDYEHARTVLDGEVGQQLLEKFDKAGIKALAWGDNGFRHMTNSRHAVNGPDDLKGLKLRTMENPIHIQAYEAFGVVPTPMAFGELFTALQQGTVDGQENPLSIITSAKFYQVQKNLTLTGHVFSPSVLLMNKDLYDRLSDDDKVAFQEAAQAAIVANRKRVDEDEASAVKFLKENGMEVVETVDRAAFEQKLAAVFEKFGKQFGAENIDKIRNAQ